MSARLVGDLVEVRPVRSVIHLDDARDSVRRAEVAGCFVPTPEALTVLRTIFARLAAREGTGVFIQGPYGCGKSHLLTYVGLAASDAGARSPVTRDPGVQGLIARVEPGSWLVAPLSLVDHPSRVSLEDLVAGCIARALEERALAPIDAPGADRTAWIAALRRVLEQAGMSGVLILIDELSEFLRAKPDARLFAEDIRFLQFLGEHAGQVPLVIAAGLQEGVEETGPIAPEAFAKIKDRYPHRFTLTADHVGALVSGRILAQRPGALAELQAIHRRLGACLPHWSLDSETFARLYPVHPATLTFLEQLKPLFSQHRGVVDFLVTRLGGSSESQIRPLLLEPAGTLLTADLILDHFRNRLRERIETLPLVDEVLGWWDANLATIYPAPADRDLARRAIKVLALASLFPFPRPISVREMAEILVVSVTDLDPALNDHMVAQVLDAAAARGAYVERAPAPDGDALSCTYVLRRGADAALLVRGRLREIAAGLEGRPEELLAALAQGFDAPHLPLATIVNQGRSRRSVSWQSTLREGWVISGDPSQLQAAERDAMAREAATTEIDFYLFIAPPSLACAPADSPLGSGQRESGASTRPGPRGAKAPAPVPAPAPAPARAPLPAPLPTADLTALPILTWRPRPIEDVAFLAQARARQVLARRLQTDPIPRAAEMIRVLEPAMADDSRHLAELATRAYFEGAIVGPAGPIEGALAGGLPPFERLLERVVSGLLEQRYPSHFTVAPTGVALGRGRLAEIVEGFLRPGSIPVAATASPVIRTILENYLKGLGLAARTGPGWHLKVDLARSEVATQVLALVGDDPVGVEELYWRLRKGPLGLGRPSFELVLCCLVFSGHLTALSQGRRVPLARLNVAGLDRIGQVAREEPLDTSVLETLLTLPFVPEKLRAQPYGPTLERQVFEEIVAQRSKGMMGTAAMAARLEHARQTRLLDHLSLDRVGEVLESLGGVLAEVRPSDSPRDGLASMHKALESRGLAGRLVELRPLFRFLEQDAARFVTIAGYIAQEELDLPATPSTGPILTRLETLRDLARRPSTCLEREAMTVFSREFDAFLDAYQNAYVADHQARRSPAALAPYARLPGSPIARFLEELVASPLVVAPQALVRARETVKAASRFSCERLSPFALRTRATCACGHRLGQESGLPPAAAVVRWLEEALDAVLRELASPERKADLARARSRLVQIGHQREAAIVTQLADLEPGIGDLGSHIARLATAPLAQVLAEAAQLDNPTERDLDVLLDRLSGKILTRAQVLEVVRQWLGNDLADTAVIKLPHRKATGGAGGGGTSPIDNPGARTGNDTLNAIRSRLGTDETLLLALVVRWARAHRVPLAAALSAAGLEAAPDAALDALERVAIDALAAAPGAEADRAVARLDSPPIQSRLHDLVARDAGLTRLLAALDAEPFLAGLSVRWARLALKALAVASRQTLRDAFGARADREGGGSPSGGGRGAADSGTVVSVGGRAAPARELVRSVGTMLARIVAVDPRRGRHPTTPPALTERFLDTIWLPEAASRVQILATQLGLESELGATGIVSRSREMLAAQAAEFATSYRAQLPTVFGAHGGPTWPHHVLSSVVPRLQKDLRPPTVHLVVVDAMRWDFYRRLERTLAGAPCPGLRKHQEESLWSLAPTVTGVNMRALLTGEAPAQDQFLPEPEDLPRPCANEASRPRLVERLTILRIGDLDDALHASGEALVHLFDALAPRVAARIVPVAESMEPGSLMVLTADHGFVEDPAYRPHGPHSRYRHGGLDPFEVIVPLVIYQKAY